MSDKAPTNDARNQEIDLQTSTFMVSRPHGIVLLRRT